MTPHRKIYYIHDIAEGQPERKALRIFLNANSLQAPVMLDAFARRRTSKNRRRNTGRALLKGNTRRSAIRLTHLEAMRIGGQLELD